MGAILLEWLFERSHKIRLFIKNPTLNTLNLRTSIPMLLGKTCLVDDSVETPSFHICVSSTNIARVLHKSVTGNLATVWIFIWGLSLHDTTMLCLLSVEATRAACFQLTKGDPNLRRSGCLSHFCVFTRCLTLAHQTLLSAMFINVFITFKKKRMFRFQSTQQS